MRTFLFWSGVVLLVSLVALAAVAAVPSNLARALDQQQQLAQENPGEPGVLNDLGNLLVLAARLDEAEAAYRESIELRPDDATARFNLALLLQQRGKHQEALRQLQEVVRLAPQHAWAHYQMGVIHEASRQTSKAVQAYAQAFTLDPQLAFPRVNPQVIDNQLLTEALLRAGRHASDQPPVPKTYSDPGRIANLLVPWDPDQAGDEPEAVPSETAVAETGEETEEGEGRTLTQNDIDPNATGNQATPQGFGRGFSTNDRFNRFLQPNNRQPNTRRVPVAPHNLRREPAPTVPPGTVVLPQRRSRPPTIPNGGRVIVPPRDGRGNGGAVRFRPGNPSTGRFELELIPPAPETATGRG